MRYGDFAAVRGIDLDVRRGEVFALLGTNGAGKTTTLEMLEGVRDAYRHGVGARRRPGHPPRGPAAADGDPAAGGRFRDAVQELQDAGRTVVLTTHHLEEAEALADRVAIMHEGRVAVAGTLADIVAA